MRQLPCIVKARLAVQSNPHLSMSLSCPLTPMRSRIVEPPLSGGSQNKNAMERSFTRPFFPDPMTKEKRVWLRETRRWATSKNHVTIYHESNITIIDIIMISFKVTVTILYATKVVKVACNKFIDVAIL